MSNRLPVQIEPLRLASQGERLKGTIALGKMLRLCSLLTAADGEASVDLCFDRDQAGVANVTGRIECIVSVICQRCMRPMQLPVETEVSLGIVHSQAKAEHLPSRYEPLIVEDGYAALSELVEDELLLALPVAPVHSVDECPEGDRFLAKQGVSKAGAGPEQQNIKASERPNPFAVLADLKAGLKKK